MKPFKTLLLVFTLTFFYNCKDHTSAHNPSTENDADLALATNLATTILEKQKAGLYHPLTEENATTAMVTGLTEARQKSSYKKLKALYGDYESLAFHAKEMITQGETLRIFRFKGRFENDTITEVRVVLNTEGKLAGFFILPWNAKL